MYYSADSVMKELNKQKQFSVIVYGGGSFGCPRETGDLFSKCCGKPAECEDGKNHACNQVLHIQSKDNDGKNFLFVRLPFKFAIYSAGSKKYDGYIRENMLSEVLNIINVKNLVPVSI
jgi:hypothetical protein